MLRLVLVLDRHPFHYLLVEADALDRRDPPEAVHQVVVHRLATRFVDFFLMAHDKHVVQREHEDARPFFAESQAVTRDGLRNLLRSIGESDRLLLQRAPHAPKIKSVLLARRSLILSLPPLALLLLGSLPLRLLSRLLPRRAVLVRVAELQHVERARHRVREDGLVRRDGHFVALLELAELLHVEQDVRLAVVHRDAISSSISDSIYIPSSALLLPNFVLVQLRRLSLLLTTSLII